MFAVLKLTKRVQELEETMLKLTRLVQSHDLDWTDMRARCKRLLDRTEKAARALEQPENSATEPQDAPDETVRALPLTPSQRRLQAMVEQRRALLGIKREAS